MMLLDILWYSTLSGTALVVAALFHRFLNWLLSPLRQLPGPQNRCFPFRNFNEIRREPFMEPCKRWWREAGIDVPLLHYNMLFWRPCLVVLDKELIKCILTAPYGKETLRFTKRSQFIRDTVGNGLVTVQGHEWVKHRRILQPAFNTVFLREAMMSAIPPRMKRFLQCWKPAAEGEWEIHVSSQMSALTLDVVGNVAFSHEFHALDALEAWSLKNTKQNNKDLSLEDVGDDLLKFFTKSFRVNVTAIICVLLGLDKIHWYINWETRKSSRLLDAAVEKVVAKARTDNTKERSLLHIMLHSRDEDVESKFGRLSESDIRGEVKTFMIAGHETTSAWLHWALFSLVRHDGVQARLFENVMNHASTDLDTDITLEQVEKMEYLGGVLQEVLRLYPPVGGFVRYNAFTEKWHGVTIPADTRLFLPIHILHRNPKYWDDPESFLPERWLNVSKEEADRRRFAFIPFSAGGRSCIGQVFATMEAKLILANLVRSYSFAIAPSLKDAKFTFHISGVTMRTKPEFKVVVHKRG